MKQILEDLRDGAIWVEDVPPPQLRDEFVLVHTHHSLISSGTEGGTVKLGRMGLLEKARARPEQAMKVLQLAKAQGPLTAYAVARRALETPIVLGYSCAGEVAAVGPGVTHVRVGDLVACAGQGYANHAQVVCVPKRLCVRIPDGVPTEHAAFTTVGAIALQSLRVADVRLGDCVVVLGLGLVGLLIAQLLRASGCRVFGLDIDHGRLVLARESGWAETCAVDAPNVNERIMAWSGGSGADAVIIAAATQDATPVKLAGQLCRRKGRVIAVGRTEMHLPRDQYLFKELELRTSMAYGPGTGDEEYELRGHDYPLPYVRWTEERNMSAFLDQVANGNIDLAKMITHRFPFERAGDAFALISGEKAEPSLGILLDYRDAPSEASPRVELMPVPKAGESDQKTLCVAVLGAGSHATNEFLPGLAKRGVEFRGIASATGVRAVALGKKYKFAYASGDVGEVLGDTGVDAVFILTRHDSHADLTARALAAGKHVFVEKPLALTTEQLNAVEAAATDKQVLMVGFNRRYAPLAIDLRDSFKGRGQPMSVVYRANVGYRPPQHWLHSAQEGGGVILGEACHHLDFCCWLIGSSVASVDVRCLGGSGAGYMREDNVHVTLTFADGSLATVMYLSNGSKAFPTETIEVSCDNRSARLVDFRRIETGTGFRRRVRRYWGGDAKGLGRQMDAFILAARNPSLFDRSSYMDSSRLTIEVDRLLRRRLVELAGGPLD